MSKDMHFASRLFKKLAKRAGVKVHIEPVWGQIGQIETPTGRKRYWRRAMFDINTLGATEIAQDKAYAKYFMHRMGYAVAKGEAFYSGAWGKAIGSKRDIDAAYRYAKRIGFPVIVKPNSKSQGAGVAKAHTRREFYTTFRKASEADSVVLVEEVLAGRDYRIVVLDNEVISAYERIPLTVVGDGRSSIRTLLRRKQAGFKKRGRDTSIDMQDWRMKDKLAHQGLTFSSVPQRGDAVALLDNANLSGGGEAVDVTNALHPSFRRLAVRLTKDMGLRLCGVDLMVNGEVKSPLREYGVLEINAAPGLDHYFSSGKEQQKVVEGLYLKLLRSMAK